MSLKAYFNTSRAYLIAVQNYENVASLSTPNKDISDIAQVLLRHDFDVENINKCIDANKAAIEEIVARMQSEIQFNDRVIFYFAGHGIARNSGDYPKGFLIPNDGLREDENSFVDMRWLADKFARLRCKHFLVILDCCFAGSFKWADSYRDSGIDQTKKIFKEKFERYVSDETDAWQLITSCSYDEEAIDELLNLGDRDRLSTNTNSPFAEILISALNGANNNAFEDGIITATRLYNYIDTEFSKLILTNGIRKQQSPGYFPLKRYTKGQFIFLDPEKRDSLLEELPELENVNPYKGLSPFYFDDTHLFFGRKNAVKNIVTTFKATSAGGVLIVSGSSGIGKSSLVMAGLIPAVLNDYPDTTKTPSIRPGNIKSKKNYIATFLETIQQLVNPFILFIDQFEEIITICTKEERLEWEEFIKTNLQNPMCRIVICMRSDFEGQLNQIGVIGNNLKTRFIVPPFSRSEIKDIVVQPALQATIKIEPISQSDINGSEFIDRICDEAMQSLGSLPLLSFALERWYEINLKLSATRLLLKEEHYNGIGGVSGALGTIIDDFLKSLRNSAELENVKRLMLRMVTVQDEAFAKVKVYDYEIDTGGGEFNTRTQRQLLEELIKRRVITTNRKVTSSDSIQDDIYYEPAHDAVLTSWKQIWEWFNSEKVNIPIFQQLSEDARKWKQANYSSALLWRDGPNLSIICSFYQNHKTYDPQKLSNKVLMTLSLGNRPKIFESENQFNSEERKFIKSSLLKVRRNKSSVNILYSLITILAIISIAFLINISIQKKKIVTELKKNYANSLANSSDQQEDASAYQSLRVADSLDSDNPAILQRAFNLFVKDQTDLDLLPKMIIPIKTRVESMWFDGYRQLLIKGYDSTFTVNLKTGKIAAGSPNLPRQSFDFLEIEQYQPREWWPRYEKCDADATEYLAEKRQPNSIFMMVSPSHIRLAQFNGIGTWPLKDSCLTNPIAFSNEITFGMFLKDQCNVLFVCSNNDINLASFRTNQIFPLIKGYEIDRAPTPYIVSEDRTLFAAINGEKNVLLWDFRSKAKYALDTTNDPSEILINEGLEAALKSGKTTFLNNKNKPITIWKNLGLPNYQGIVANDSNFEEYVVYDKKKNRYFLRTAEDSTFKIMLPPAPDNWLLQVNFSRNGNFIYYSMKKSIPNADVNTPRPDSILAKYPSIKMIKHWLYENGQIVTDTIK